MDRRSRILNKKISVITFIISIIVTVTVVFMLTFTLLSDYYRGQIADIYDSEEVSDTDDGSADVSDEWSKLYTVDALFNGYSYFDIDRSAVLDGVLKGYAESTGDKYAEYYTVEEYTELVESSNGEMQGIGINIIENAEYNAIEIISVMPDSPALEAGVEPGDLIVSVGIGDDAESVSELGYYPAVAKLQGKAGTTCEFTVMRGENYGEKHEFSIERGYVTSVSVMYHIYEADPTIGVIKIIEFNGETPNQFIDAIESLGADGVEKFIFDVRYNPGGDLNAICSVLDYILPEGPIIRTKDKSGTENVITSDENEFIAPMAVLCNGSTASAAELFTSALMDYDKATVIGEKTYGKGSMQSILPLGDGSGIKVTSKMYFPPYSDGYDGIGITPDIEVAQDEALAGKNIYKITDEEDRQLQAAVSYLTENY